MPEALTVAKVALVILVAVLVQLAIVARFPIAGYRGDVILLVAIAAGLEGDAMRGAVVGFVAGITFDVFLTSPFGLSALTYCLVGYLVGSFQGRILRTSWWIPVLATVVGSAVGVLIYALIDRVLGDTTTGWGALGTIVVVVAGINALASRPARWALRHALSEPGRRGEHFSLR